MGGLGNGTSREDQDLSLRGGFWSPSPAQSAGVVPVPVSAAAASLPGEHFRVLKM